MYGCQSKKREEATEGVGRRQLEGVGRRQLEGVGRRQLEGVGRRQLEGVRRRQLEGVGRRQLEGVRRHMYVCACVHVSELYALCYVMVAGILGIHFPLPHLTTRCYDKKNSYLFHVIKMTL